MALNLSRNALSTSSRIPIREDKLGSDGMGFAPRGGGLVVSYPTLLAGLSDPVPTVLGRETSVNPLTLPIGLVTGFLL